MEHDTPIYSDNTPIAFKLRLSGTGTFGWAILAKHLDILKGNVEETIQNNLTKQVNDGHLTIRQRTR